MQLLTSGVDERPHHGGFFIGKI